MLWQLSTSCVACQDSLDFAWVCAWIWSLLRLGSKHGQIGMQQGSGRPTAGWLLGQCRYVCCQLEIDVCWNKMCDLWASFAIGCGRCSSDASWNLRLLSYPVLWLRPLGYTCGNEALIYGSRQCSYVLLFSDSHQALGCSSLVIGSGATWGQVRKPATVFLWRKMLTCTRGGYTFNTDSHVGYLRSQICWQQKGAK